MGCSPNILLKSRPYLGCLLPWVSNKASSHERENHFPFHKKAAPKAQILAKEMLHKFQVFLHLYVYTHNHFRKHLSFWATFSLFFFSFFFFSHLKEESKSVFIVLTWDSLHLDDISCQLNAENLMVCIQNILKHRHTYLSFLN